jgi:hypothetical protein
MCLYEGIDHLGICYSCSETLQSLRKHVCRKSPNICRTIYFIMRQENEPSHTALLYTIVY